MLLTKLANQEIVNFLRTATVKNSFFADQLLKALVLPQYQSSLPSELNPYYLHITGQYILKKDILSWVTDPSTGAKIPLVMKSSQSMIDKSGNRVTVSNGRIYDEFAYDEMMYVTSLDTKDEIPFTREVLHGCGGNTAIHKKTLAAYKVGSKYFDTLCDKYPKQVDLIKSIVYLIPEKELTQDEIYNYGESLPSSDSLRMLNALSADHLSLLSCDASILESREKLNIVSAFKSILDIFRERYSIQEYTYEDNYASVLWSALWSILPLALTIQRYANIKTSDVHSSHVWDYLTSHGLDSYKGYLTTEQELFLYKNIKYLRDHGGEHRVLNILVDNLLSEYHLHIEEKTAVINTTDTLSVDTVGSGYDTQCSRCAKNEVCFKRIKNRECADFLGTKNTCKPTTEILSEDLPGAQKERIINLLKTRYGCSQEEAESRYARSFMWVDEAIEKIREELDRDQSVVMGRVTDTLDQTIYSENQSGLEPIYNQGVVDAQQTDLRHARSAAIPTKLLEIVEDPTEPKYEEMFTRFVTDTLFHLAPTFKNGAYHQLVDETFRVLIGQETSQSTLTYGEVLAIMYLGFLKEFKPDLVIDTYTSVEKNSDKVNNPFKDNRVILTDLNNYISYGFKVPSETIISTTFKLGKPVKQQDLIDAMGNIDSSLNDLGSYIVTEDSARVEGKTYYTREIDGYIEYTGDILEDNVTYYEFKNLAELVTNDGYVYVKSDNEEEDTDPKFSLVSIDGNIYAVALRKYDSTKDLDWEPFSIYDPDNEESRVVYEILGRFDLVGGGYVYHENDSEIPIIPKYVKWFYKHLGVYQARTRNDLLWLPLENGDLAYSWAEKTGYKVVVVDENVTLETQFSDSSSPENLKRTTFVENDDDTVAQEVDVYAQNILAPANIAKGWVSDDYKFISSVIRINDQSPALVDDDGNPVELERFGIQLTSYYDMDKESVYELVEVDKLLNVDWINSNLYVDAMNGFNSNEDLGEYLEKMFTLLERLDAISSSCGDIKTKLVIKEYLDRVLVGRTRKEFRLLQLGEISYPTYDDWFEFNPDIGDAIKKIDSSNESAILWNELNLKVFSEVLKYCNLTYASSSTSKAKYRKLKELVKSLSSYLVNYIDNESNKCSGVELSHISHDSEAGKIKFTSYVDFEITKQTFNYYQIGDLDRDLYLPATEDHAMEGVEYYVYKLDTINNREDYFGFYLDENLQVGASLLDEQRYFKVNLRDVLGIPENRRFRIIRYNGKWYYQTGFYATYMSEVETYPSDDLVTNVKECQLTEEAEAAAGGVDLKVSNYYKEVASNSVEWDGEVLPVGDKVTEYLDLMTLSYHMASYSNLAYDLDEYENSDLHPIVADYLVTDDDAIRTPHTSQL